MAGYCHGANAPYGCGHHAEHVAAAKKGWITRRRGQPGTPGADFEGSEQQRLVSLFLGEQISLAHSHAEHPQTVVFKSKGKWYELPRRQFQRFVSGGREQEREQRKREREQQKRSRQELEYALYQERASGREGGADAFRANLVKKLQKGGVRPTYNRATGKTYDLGEWQRLPSSIRRKSGKYTLDQARELAEEEAEVTGQRMRFETPDDLVNFFEEDYYRRQQSAARRRDLREQIAQLRPSRASRAPQKRRSA